MNVRQYLCASIPARRSSAAALRAATLPSLAGMVLAAVACTSPAGGDEPAEMRATLVAAAPTQTASPAAADAPAPAASSPQPAASLQLVVSAVGDCAIGDLRDGAGAPGTFTATLAALGEDVSYPFARVKSVLASDDLTIANLEGTLTREVRYQNPGFAIRGKPEHAAVLAEGSVELVNLANNHSGDYGPSGYADTESALDSVGVGHFGNGRVDRRRVRGIEVVNLGYLGGPRGTRGRMERDVGREKAAGGIIIVSFHWGIETFHQAAPDQVRLGHAAIDAGADLVLGHHPHVLQGIETYRGRHIVYSLGNFVFGANGRPVDFDSMIYQERFELDGAAVRSVEGRILPVRISGDVTHNDYRPVLLDGDEATRVRGKIDDLSRPFGELLAAGGRRARR